MGACVLRTLSNEDCSAPMADLATLAIVGIFLIACAFTGDVCTSYAKYSTYMHTICVCMYMYTCCFV